MTKAAHEAGRFNRVDVLLVARGDALASDLLQAVEATVAIVRRAEIEARVATPLTPAAVPHARFDTVLSVGHRIRTIAELWSALTGFADQFGDLIDAEQCAIIAGRVREVIPGDGSTFVHYPLRRIARLDVDEFQAHWASAHATLARAVPGLSGYRQLHADVDETQAAARAAGVGVVDFVGAAEGRRASAVALPPARGPELDAVLADEHNFIDVTRCGPTMYAATANGPPFGG